MVVSIINIFSFITLMLEEMGDNQIKKVHKVNYLKYVNVCLYVLVACTITGSSRSAKSMMNNVEQMKPPFCTNLRRI